MYDHVTHFASNTRHRTLKVVAPPETSNTPKKKQTNKQTNKQKNKTKTKTNKKPTLHNLEQHNIIVTHITHSHTRQENI